MNYQLSYRGKDETIMTDFNHDGLGSLVTRLSTLIKMTNKDSSISYYPYYINKELPITGDFFINTMPLNTGNYTHNVTKVTKEHKGFKTAWSMFETDDIPKEFKEVLNDYDSIYVTEEYLRNIYQKYTDRKVHVLPIPNGLYVNEIDNILVENRTRPINDTFTILYIASGNRKNFEGLIEAFYDTMPNNVRLILHNKVNNMRDMVSSFLYNKIRRDKRIKISTGTLDKEQIIGYYKSASLYVSPSDGEGWNLPVREAMLYGVPVLCSNNTVHGLHINDGAIPIDCNPVSSKADGSYINYGLHNYGRVHHIIQEDLVNKMKMIYDNYDVYKSGALLAAESEYKYSYEYMANTHGLLFDIDYLKQFNSGC